MFMRTTFIPACQARVVMPRMYPEFDEPSRPWSSTSVRRSARIASGCQWQMQRTRLPSAGSTSTSSSVLGRSSGGRGKKFPTMVCRWPLDRPRRGLKGRNHAGIPVRVVKAPFVSVAVRICIPSGAKARAHLLHLRQD